MKIKNLPSYYRLVKEPIPSYERRFITNAQTAADLFSKILSSLPHEEMHVASIGNSSNILGLTKIAQGTTGSCYVHLKDVFKLPIVLGACAIVLAHNHPSGNLTPSDDDLILTKKVKEAGEFLGISVLDHLVIANDKYWSMLEHNQL